MIAAAHKMHWSAAYVGAHVDCWGAVRKVWEGEFSETLPIDSGAVFEPIEAKDAREFDLVVFNLAGIDDHVGIICGKGIMLHSPAGAVLVEPYATGRWKLRIIGYYRFSQSLPLPVAPIEVSPDFLNVAVLSFFNPGHGRVQRLMPPGLSLSEVIRGVLPGISEEQRSRLGVSIGSVEYDYASWGAVFPFPGAVITIKPIPGAFPFRTFLSLAIIVASVAAGQYYGPILAASVLGPAAASGTAASISSALITAGLAIAGTTLVNALIPNRADREDSPVFAATGWHNEPRPYGTIPAVLGKHRQAPPYAAFPYMQVGFGGLLYLHGLFVHGIGQHVLSDHRFGDTPVDEFDPTTIEQEHREGLPGDAPVSLYPHQVVPTASMGVNLPHFTPIVRLTARDAEEIEIIYGHPRGLIDFDSDGDPINTEVHIVIRQRLVGSGVWENVDTIITGADRKTAFFGSYRWTPAVRGQYEVELTMHPIDFDDDTTICDTQWLELYAHRPEYPLNCEFPLAVTAFRVKASEQLQGTIDTYNCIASRVAPDWDGANWVEQETDNPVSLARWALQGAANAKPSPDEKIELSEFEEAAEYATVKGLHYNRVHDFQESLPDALTDILAAARSTPRRVNKTWGIVTDKPQTIVAAHITPRNGWEIETSRTAERLPDAYTVNFKDRDGGYEQRQRIVPFPGKTEEECELFEAIDLPGLVTAEEVWMGARWKQYQVLHRRKTYRAAVGWDGISFGRGALARMDDTLNRKTVSALVRSVTGSTVELDERVTMEEGGSYEIRFRHLPDEDDEGADPPPAESIVRTVTTIPGKSNAIYLSGAGTVPKVDALVIFGETGSSGRDLIVTRIERGDNDTARLTLQAHAPEIETLMDAEVAPDWDGRVGEILNTPEQVAPDNVAGSYVFEVRHEVVAFIKANFDAVTGAYGYELQWREVAGDGVIGSVNGTASSLELISKMTSQSKIYEIRVRAVGAPFSSWVTVPDVSIFDFGVDGDDNPLWAADDDSLVAMNI